MLGRARDEALALLALGGMLALGWVLATSLSVGGHGWKAGLLHGLGPYLSSPEHRGVIVALAACYLVVVWCGTRGALPRRAVIVTLVVISVLFALSAISPRQDLYTYLGFGRLDAVHGISPYDRGLIAAPADPLFQLAVGKWRYGTTPYGPLFTLVSMATALLPIAAAAWTLKGVLCAAMLGCVLLVGLIARELGRDGTLAAAFVGLNPAILIYVFGKGHNDGLMMLPLLLAALLLVRRRERGAGVSTAVAVGVKISALVVLPFLAIAAANRRRLAIGVALGVLAVAAVTLPVFGLSPIHVLSSARRDQGLVHGDFSLLGLIGQGLGLDWHTAARNWGTAIFLTLYALVLLATLRRPRQWLRWSGWAMVALLATSASLWPWYLAWLLPFAALAGDRKLTIGAYALTAVSIGFQF